MPKIVCVKCSVEYKPLKNGVTVLETRTRQGFPYQAYDADALECPGCKNVIVTGFAKEPFLRAADASMEEIQKVVDNKPCYSHEYTGVNLARRDDW